MIALLAILKRVPIQTWVVLGAVIALLGGVFAWGYSRGKAVARAAADQAMAAHLHADSLARTTAGVEYTRAIDSAIVAAHHEDSIRQRVSVAIRSVHDTVLLPGQVIHDTLRVAKSSDVERLGMVCDSLAQADSIAAELAFSAKTACDARHRTDSSLIADLSARVRLAQAPIPRLSIKAGLGYDVLLGRPLVSGETELHLLGPVSAAFSVDLVRGLAQPVEARGRILWRF